MGRWGDREYEGSSPIPRSSRAQRGITPSPYDCERSEQSPSGRRLLHVADKRLGLVDGDVGVTDHQREVVGDRTGDESLVAPVPRQADVMNGLATNDHGTHASRY